jgi:hypothetical protein
MLCLGCAVLCVLQRRRLNWKQAERDALKRQLMGLGLGRWKEVRQQHQHMSSSNSSTNIEQQQQQLCGGIFQQGQQQSIKQQQQNVVRSRRSRG